MFFRFVPGNITQGQSTNWVCEVGAMTVCNILGTDKRQLKLYLLTGYFEDLPKWNKNFLYSHEIRIAMISRQEKVTPLCCNDFRFSGSPMFTNKATIFLDDRLYWKISARRHRLLGQWKCSIGCTNISIMTTSRQWYRIKTCRYLMVNVGLCSVTH